MQSPPRHGVVPGAAGTTIRTAARRSASHLALAAAAGVFFVLVTVTGSVGEVAAQPRQASTDSHRQQRGVAPRPEIRPSTRSAARPAAGRRAAAKETPKRRRVRSSPVAPPTPKAEAVVLPSISPHILMALQSAGGTSRDDHVLLFALAWRESRCDPKAQNPASTARGLMQFTRNAWLEAIRDYGKTHGLASYAAALTTNHATGEITVRDPRLLAELLVLRDDPRLSAALAMARLERERAKLAQFLRRPVTDADLYMVHFLGSEGARRFLRQLARTPSRRASSVVGSDSVAANRNVFVAGNGRHRSLRQVYHDVRTTLRSQHVVYARLLDQMNGPMEVAEKAPTR